MSRNRFIVLLCLLGLQDCLSTSSVNKNDNVLKESLSTFEGATLLLFSTATENFTLPEGCVKSHTCVVSFLQGNNLTLVMQSLNSMTVPRFFVRGVLRPVEETYRLIDDTDNETIGKQSHLWILYWFSSINNYKKINDVTILNNQSNYNDFNYAECGVYPACSVRYLSRNVYSFTCDRPLMTFAAAMGIILSVIIIVSNIFIITVTMRTKSLRKPHGFFKLSLAVADLIAGIFILPSIVHNTLNTIDYDQRVYTSNEVAVLASVGEINSNAAIFFGVMGILSTITAVYSLLLMSVDRFLSVLWPMEYRIGDVMNSKRAAFGVAFVWIFSLLVAFLPILAKDALQYGLSYYTFMYIPIILPLTSDSDDAAPIVRYVHAVVYSVFVWGVPFMATWILTIVTSIESRKMLKNMREARRRSVRSKRNLDKVDRDLIRTVTVVLCLFTITVLPVFAITLAVALIPYDSCTSNVLAVLFFVVTYVFIGGRFLNVLIYNVFNKEFRTASLQCFNEAMEVLCCHRAMEIGLPKQSSSAKKSSSWESKKSKDQWDSKETKETGITTRSPSASTTITTFEKGMLSPGVPSSSKLSTSAIYEGDETSSPSQLAEGNSVFTLDIPKK